jgi:beta-lactamase class A
MRRFVIFIFYSFFLLIIGRNLLFIPQISIGGDKKIKDTQSIRQDVLDLLKTKKGEFNVCYTDLITGESFGIHPDTVLTAASLNKLPIIGYLYSLAAKKEIDLQETIVIQKSDIQDYGTGIIRYADPGQSYTLQYLAQLSLQKSDNTAAHVLDIRLGEDNFQEYASQLGMAATNMIDNDTSCRDMETFFKALYSNKITSPSYTKEILGYMEDTDFEDRLPLFLPKTLHIYHKTGDGVNFVHDAGIISNGKTPFVLVVTSSNIPDEKDAKETIGKIAQTVYIDRGNK